MQGGASRTISVHLLRSGARLAVSRTGPLAITAVFRTDAFPFIISAGRTVSPSSFAMNKMPPFTLWTLFALLFVVSCAAGVRIWYVAACTEYGYQEAALLVQGLPPESRIPTGATYRARAQPTELDNLTENLAEQRRFAGWAPLANEEETTAHIAPGYPLLLGGAETLDVNADALMRWLQCALGSLTVGCYFFFARRAFHSTPIAIVAGLLTALHPFWIINTAELNDGVLAGFLLSASLALGARAAQIGGAFTGLLFGVTLALLALVRAAMLPFSILALLWFLWHCRRLPLGWFAGFLALIGLANGLVPWMLRNYQAFDRVVPVASSTYLHLWIGNNPNATGSALDEATLRASLSEDRVKELLDERNQAKRYHHLADDVRHEIEDHPTETLSRRVTAALMFFLGERWFKERRLSIQREPSDDIAAPPEWLADNAEVMLLLALIGMFVLAFLGWRWSHPWRRQARVATIAALMIPLPYVLSHAEHLSGPRLPLDGVLLCYAAFALVSLIPGLVQPPEPEPELNDEQR